MCIVCCNTGLIANGPEGEAIFCEDCVRGLTMALRTLELHMEADAACLDRSKAEGHASRFGQIVFAAELAEHERLQGLLREKQREGEFVEADL